MPVLLVKTSPLLGTPCYSFWDEIIIFKFFSDLFFESSYLDTVQFDVGAKLIGMLLFGEIQKLAIKCSLLTALHFLLELIAGFRVFTGDMATKRLASLELFLTIGTQKSLIWINYLLLPFTQNLFLLDFLFIDWVFHFFYLLFFLLWFDFYLIFYLLARLILLLLI